MRRAPGPRLRRLLSTVWAFDGTAPEAARERVLPTGAMHVVIRLDGAPVRVFAGDEDGEGRTFGFTVVGGARAAPYLRATAPARSIGAQLRPGAARALLGVPAGALAERHTSLADLWAGFAEEARERLDAAAPERRLDVFEELLAARVSGEIDAVVEHAALRIEEGAKVAEVVAESGYSHRGLVTRFRDAVGLTPKVYARVTRLQKALARASERPQRGWAEIAIEAGYADQAHLSRDFRELAGVSPGAYRASAPARMNHVPIRG